MTSPGRVFSREQLLDGVWGHDVYVDERTVDVHVGRLRKALNKARRRILSVPSVVPDTPSMTSSPLPLPERNLQNGIKEPAFKRAFCFSAVMCLSRNKVLFCDHPIRCVGVGADPAVPVVAERSNKV